RRQSKNAAENSGCLIRRRKRLLQTQCETQVFGRMFAIVAELHRGSVAIERIRRAFALHFQLIRIYLDLFHNHASVDGPWAFFTGFDGSPVTRILLSARFEGMA